MRNSLVGSLDKELMIVYGVYEERNCHSARNNIGYC
jgi:hypothetical protein